MFYLNFNSLWPRVSWVRLTGGVELLVARLAFLPWLWLLPAFCCRLIPSGSFVLPRARTASVRPLAWEGAALALKRFVGRCGTGPADAGLLLWAAPRGGFGIMAEGFGGYDGIRFGLNWGDGSLLRGRTTGLRSSSASYNPPPMDEFSSSTPETAGKLSSHALSISLHITYENRCAYLEHCYAQNWS